MKKNIIALAGVLATIALIGAGCASAPENKSDANKDNGTTPLVLDNVVATTTATASELVLTVEKTEAGTAKLTWTGLTSEKGYRLFHSTKNLPTDNAFWQWENKNQTEFVWKGIPAGKRFFRACEWLGDQCGKYSNEVEITIE